jgi:ATP-dependent protease ClpP protease subunit
MPFIDLPERIPGLRAQARSDRPWYRITNQAADEAEVMLYDEVGGWLGATADEFINDLRGITAPNILLRVNSPGGSVTEGIAIANALRSHPANVTVQVDGVAASIASVIAIAGDHVRMMPNALLMVHEASGLCVGEAADMIKMAEVLDKISDNIAGAYAARAGGTEAEWRQVMKNETWYRGDEAVKAGLADEVVSTPKRGDDATEPEMRQEFDLTAYGYTGPSGTGGTVEQPTAVGEDSCTLTIPIGSALGEQLAAALRASVAPSAEPEPPATTAEPAEEPAPEPETPAEPEPADEWAADAAALLTTPADDWAADLTHLIGPDTSSRAATAA